MPSTRSCRPSHGLPLVVRLAGQIIAIDAEIADVDEQITESFRQHADAEILQSMIKAKLVLQLRNQGLSGRAISSAQGMSRHSIQAVLDAADRAGLGWDDVVEMPEGEVYSALFPGRGVRESVFVQPDWARVHRELARVGMTQKLLHQEYGDVSGRAGQAVMSYDRFCRLYGEPPRASSSSAPPRTCWNWRATRLPR
jgi:hypothetical protein